jgi:asparagine synthase (glutamine-hydrolysing)
VALKSEKYCSIRCYTVGFDDSPDFKYVRIFNKSGIDVCEILLDLEILEAALIEVVNLLGEPNPLAVGVGVPMYLASKKAGEEGLEVMLCGQGADELFGGYWRYLESYVNEGPNSVVEWMKQDVDTADADNLDRDRLVTSANNIELRFPFLKTELVEYALNLPLEHRIKEVDSSYTGYECVDEVDKHFFIRKHILRKVAEENNVPYEIINRRKKAAQYGSGVHKNMEKLARKKGFKKKATETGEKSYLKLYLESLMK